MTSNHIDVSKKVNIISVKTLETPEKKFKREFCTPIVNIVDTRPCFTQNTFTFYTE